MPKSSTPGTHTMLVSSSAVPFTTTLRFECLAQLRSNAVAPPVLYFPRHGDNNLNMTLPESLTGLQRSSGGWTLTSSVKSASSVHLEETGFMSMLAMRPVSPKQICVGLTESGKKLSSQDKTILPDGPEFNGLSMTTFKRSSYERPKQRGTTDSYSAQHATKRQ